MEKIIVIYGGKSVEHDISIITAIQAMNAVKKEYDILPIYITREGKFYTGDNLLDVNIYANFLKKAKNLKKVYFEFGTGKVIAKGGIKKQVHYPSCALVCNHGLNGEDGSVSALMELAGIAYSCPSTLASAICMDKAFTKMILKQNNIPVCDYLYGANIDLKNAKKLGFPLIVKPAKGGSSIGIQKCTDEQELIKSIEFAKNFDKNVILEHFFEKKREFNCACLISGEKILPSKVCEVKSKDFYDFDEKYISDKPNAKLKIEKSLEKEIKNLTIKTCLTLGCEGVVRVDFIMDENGSLFVNEVNTIPGSLAFYLFSNMKEVVVELIEGAKQRKGDKDRLTYVFPSTALNIFVSANMNKYAKK